jgi:YVTN family beta-propeller protein
MRTKLISVIAILTVSALVSSCKKDKPEVSNGSSLPDFFDNPVYVVNEGSFSNGSGTITYYNKQNGKAYQNVFQSRNSFPLGSIAQSMNIFNGKAYIVVNNASKVEIVNPDNFVIQGTINGLTLPRYFLGIDNSKAYISEWGVGGSVGAIKVVDLNTKNIVQTITTGSGAEEMVKIGNNVYVACNGGYGADSILSVINSQTNTVTQNIVVGANPSSMQVDANGKLWVLCLGKWNSSFSELEKEGSLVRINPTNNQVELSLSFNSIYSQPTRLAINGAKTELFYLYNNGIHSHNITSSTLSSVALVNRGFYSLGIDSTTNIIYAGDVLDYSSNGKVIRYALNGNVVDSFASGVIPSYFCFR